MFSKQQLDSQKLPPTNKAFRKKVIEAHYTALHWNHHLSSPSLPDPGDNGWKWDSTNSLCEPATPTLPPAPETIIDLIVYNCKTSCVSLRCKRRKSG